MHTLQSAFPFLAFAAAAGIGYAARTAWAPKSGAAVPDGDALAGLQLWNAHACLNALSRCVVSAADPLPDDHPLYLVADHLKALVRTSKFDGWVEQPLLLEWLDALLALHQCVSQATAATQRQVDWPQELAQIQLASLGQVLTPLLHDAGAVARVELRILRTPYAAPHATSQEQVAVDVLVYPADAAPGRAAELPPARVRQAQALCAARLA